jgi:DNA-binding transcriptional LysR family regulator
MVSDMLRLAEGNAMKAIQSSERPVQPVAQAVPVERDDDRLVSLLDRFHWDDLVVLRTLGKTPSFRKAALEIGVSVNTVRSRLERLEQSLGSVLFARGREGLKITAEGRSVLSVANEMRSLSSRLPIGQGNNALVREGEIRICATEGVGTFWLTPRLPELKCILPELLVSLDSFSDQTRLSPSEFDISIGFSRPDDQEAIVSKLATTHVIPFASELYLRQHGMPQSLDDMRNHRCVQQSAPGLKYDSIELFFGAELAREITTLRVSSSFSLFWAVVNGVGIGALPTYIRAVSRRVQPVNIPIQLKFDLWLSYNRAARGSIPVRQTVEWLRTCFDANRYPWFADGFVHPEDFNATHDDPHVVPLFDHLIDDPS